MVAHGGSLGSKPPTRPHPHFLGKPLNQNANKRIRQRKKELYGSEIVAKKAGQFFEQKWRTRIGNNAYLVCVSPVTSFLF